MTDTITLRPKLSARERILGFGVQGTGKSNALLTIARKCPTDTFYVMDNDYGSYIRLLETDFTDIMAREPTEDIGKLEEEIEKEASKAHKQAPSSVVIHGNVVVFDIDMYDWEPYLVVTPVVVRRMSRDDWMVVDNLTVPWDSVQNWYTEKVFDQGIDEYFLEARIKKASSKNQKERESSSLNALEGWVDWSVINPQMFKFYATLLKCPGHQYWTAETAKLDKDEDKEVRAVYGPYGVKPKGQKKLPHMPHTVLLMTKSRAGEYELTTIKDRGREELVGVECGNFVVDYLQKVAGWRPSKVGV